jgi:O-antigen ligase
MIEALFDSPLSRLGQPDANDWTLLRNPGRGLSILIVLFWAGLGGWANGKGFTRAHGWILLLPIAWLAANSYMAANLLSFVAGALGFAAGLVASRIALAAVFSALAAWFMAAPWILPSLLDALRSRLPTLPESWDVRTSVWRFAAARIAENPIFGMGLDGSRSFAGQQAITNGVVHDVIPLHPHNIALQIWLETGLVGAALAATALLIAGFGAARALSSHRWASASACAALAAIAVQWNVSYGAWQEWMIALAFTAIILIGAGRRHPPAHNDDAICRPSRL